MKKIMICGLLILLITGCRNNISSNTVSYNLDITDRYKEKIIIALPKNAYEIAKKYSPFKGQYISLEYTLLNEKIYPINTNSTIYYDKKIDKKDNQVNVTLTNDYSEKDFLYESYIYKCFENYNLESAEDSFEISLFGKYYCNNQFDKLVINITNSNYILDSNGTKTKNGYTWTIDKNNFDNVNIHYMFSRDYDSMPTNVTQNNSGVSPFKRIFSFITLIIMIILIVFLYNLYKRYKYTSMNMDM